MAEASKTSSSATEVKCQAFFFQFVILCVEEMDALTEIIWKMRQAWENASVRKNAKGRLRFQMEHCHFFSF